MKTSAWGTSNVYPQHMFSWRNKKNILWLPALIWSYVFRGGDELTWWFLFQGKLGELLLSLCYEPNVGRLTVIVIKAKDLKAKDITGASGL